VKLFLKNKNIFFAKNHCEFQVRTFFVWALYGIIYGNCCFLPVLSIECLFSLPLQGCPLLALARIMHHALFNGRESTVNRMPDGSTYPS
jgi:hypothetical protein